MRIVALCEPFEKVQTAGHFTHDPVPGKFSCHLKDQDANGKDKSQYYTENHDKTKEVAAKTASNYIKNKELIPDSKFDAYLQNVDIIKKIP